jgi:GxxExxY protein
MHLADLTYRIIACAHDVANSLGPGLLERTYEHALTLALTDQGIAWNSQNQFPVEYRGRVVGTYIPDLIVENTVIVEVKCQREFCARDDAQILSYLRISGCPVGLLLNFHGRTVGVRRHESVPKPRSGSA